MRCAIITWCGSQHTSLQGDWSSDVCSPDLMMLSYGRLAAFGAVLLSALLFACIETSAQQIPKDIAARTEKIGRASCRGRGCRDGAGRSGCVLRQHGGAQPPNAALYRALSDT